VRIVSRLTDSQNKESTMRASYLATSVLLMLASFAVAEEKSLDDQYVTVGNARTQAELAIRKIRTFFENSDTKWKAASFAADAAKTQASEAIRKAIEDEQKKVEELRNQAVIEDLNQRRAQLDLDWQKFTTVDRPAIEASYRGANQSVQGINQVYQSVVQMEPNWKDAKVNLETLQSAYEAIAKRANEIREQGETALADLQKAQKMWEGVSAATTRPADVKR
jgi:hypothetical protein